MSKYQEYKEIFENAISFLEKNQNTTERFYKLVHELAQHSNRECTINILLCLFLQEQCFKYKLDRAYAGRKMNVKRKEINSHPERFGQTSDELALIIQSYANGYINDHTEDYKRIAKEMSELVHERGWENEPY